MSATAFAPNQTATREQMVTFLARFAEFSGVDTTATGDLGDFTDASKVSAYAEDAMTWAVHTGIIHGMGNGKLDPRAPPPGPNLQLRFCDCMTCSRHNPKTV